MALFRGPDIVDHEKPPNLVWASSSTAVAGSSGSFPLGSTPMICRVRSAAAGESGQGRDSEAAEGAPRVIQSIRRKFATTSG